jgi:glycosyltransferase involved in cell wall biosynthesis
VTIERDVTLVVPARDAMRTLGSCLDAIDAVRNRPGSRLGPTILVDDGSIDGTGDHARSRGVEVVSGVGRGPAAARNLGWRRATTPLVWFLDSDCVAAPDALERLLPHLEDPAVAGVGGTYSIAPDATLLERLIHEEIVVRHARMPVETDFLATFDVLYRREVLERFGGFDERYITAEDAEFGFRLLDHGRRLRFERGSVVRHFHANRLMKYLRMQRTHGYWRVLLHLERPGRGRTAYSGAIDHLQPFLAAVLLPLVLVAIAATVLSATGTLGTAWAGAAWVATAVAALVLLAAQLPIAAAMARREGAAMWWFVPLGWIRSLWRAAGMVAGVVDRAVGRGSMAKRGPAPGAAA